MKNDTKHNRKFIVIFISKEKLLIQNYIKIKHRTSERWKKSAVINYSSSSMNKVKQEENQILFEDKQIYNRIDLSHFYLFSRDFSFWFLLPNFWSLSDVNLK